MKKFALILFFTFAFCLLPFHLKAQWVQQTVPVSKPITGIKFIDTLKGWACTSIGMSGANYAYILHTTNGGITWFVQDSSFNTNYQAISVIDANVIYAGGDSVGFGKLSKTTNGGMNWVYLQLPINMTIGDMQFLNQDSGWTCVNLFGADVRTTTNGGLSWTVRTNGIASQTLKIFFINYNNGFCGANNNVIYKTTNAGLNWNFNGNFSTSIESIYFLNINTGWVGLSPNGGSAKVSHTTNGGSNWVSQSLDPYNLNVDAISFINNLTGWAGIDFNKIYKTTDGGSNWGYQNNSTGSDRISFIDSINGWTGDFGISRTTNGGGNMVAVQQTGFGVPISYSLHQNYPNPFNPSTEITFDVKTKNFVKLIVFDILGREVDVLVNEKLNAGSYKYLFNAKNIPNGVYFYKLQIETYSETRKMILIK